MAGLMTLLGWPSDLGLVYHTQEITIAESFLASGLQCDSSKSNFGETRSSNDL